MGWPTISNPTNACPAWSGYGPPRPTCGWSSRGRADHFLRDEASWCRITERRHATPSHPVTPELLVAALSSGRDVFYDACAPQPARLMLVRFPTTGPPSLQSRNSTRPPLCSSCNKHALWQDCERTRERSRRGRPICMSENRGPKADAVSATRGAHRANGGYTGYEVRARSLLRLRASAREELARSCALERCLRRRAWRPDVHQRCNDDADIEISNQCFQCRGQ